MSGQQTNLETVQKVKHEVGVIKSCGRTYLDAQDNFTLEIVTLKVWTLQSGGN